MATCVWNKKKVCWMPEDNHTRAHTHTAWMDWTRFFLAFGAFDAALAGDGAFQMGHLSIIVLVGKSVQQGFLHGLARAPNE